MTDTITLTDAEFALEIESMRKAGADAGHAAATWLVDGNTDEDTARRILAQWDEGDCNAPHAPAPFSGEWADDPTVSDVIERETSLEFDSLTPEEIDELTTAFEDAYAEAWQDEAERSVRAILS